MVHTQEPAPAASDVGVNQAPSRAQQLMGDFAPKLAELTDNVLFGDVWERPGLSKRDRSLITVGALIAMNRPDQLRSHLEWGRKNGLTEAEVVEVIWRSMPACQTQLPPSPWPERFSGRSRVP